MPSSGDLRPSNVRSRTLRRTAAVLTGGVMLLVAACSGATSSGVSIEPATTTPPTGVTATEVPSTARPEVTGAATEATTPPAVAAPQADLADHFLGAVLRDPAASERTDIEVHAVPLSNLGGNLWLAATSGSGIAEILGDRQQVVGIYQQDASGEWVELLVRRLESTPTETTVELIDAVGTESTAWAAVFGDIAGAGTTFELLRYDGEALTSALWWYSPSGEAARLIDLDGDALPELVIDASDTAVLCAACGVTDYQEVIYRWEQGFIRAVEFAPLERESEASTTVADGIAQTRAGLWARAAATFAEGSNLASDDANVRWMDHLASRIAEGRLARAGDAAQPLLTNVLAGEYEAAFTLISALPPEEALSSAGPLVSGTSAEGHEVRMGELLVDHASRAVEYDPALAPAYAVRALGHMLLDGDARASALADLEQAAGLESGDGWYDAAVAWLEAAPPPTVEATPQEPDGDPTAEPTSELATPDDAESESSTDGA